MSLSFYAQLSVRSSFAIKFCKILFSFCQVTVSVLCPFLTMQWDGLQYVIVAFPGHTHLPFGEYRTKKSSPLITCIQMIPVVSST